MTSRTSFKVLLIDDDGTLARMLSEYLSSYGLAVDWAKDAEEALEKVRGASPDVVILDVMLPGLDGLGLLPRLRAINDLPVLMLTARTRHHLGPSAVGWQVARGPPSSGRARLRGASLHRALGRRRRRRRLSSGAGG